MSITIDIFAILWYIYTVCEPFTMSVLRTFLASFLLGTSLGMPTLALAQDSLVSQQECIPQFSVDFQLPERVIVVDQRDSCPVSTQVYVKLADDRRELRLIAHQSQNYSGRWVTQVDPVAQGGLYRVVGVEYLNGQMAPPLDQRITIPGARQEQSAPALPQLTLPLAPRQQESRPEPSQAQGGWITLDLGALLNCFLRTPIRFNGGMIDLNPWKACLPH